MVSLTALWLPILLSAVIIFVVSSVIHMVLPYHRSDYHQLPDEDRVMAALRSAGLKPGPYVFPYCTHKNMKSPDTIEKFRQGPVGRMNVMPNGAPALPKFLVQWFIYCLLIGFFVAYLAGHTVASGADYLAVFRVVGTAAFLGYGLGNLSNGIWKAEAWSNIFKEVFDGLVYALLTAGTFGWLWPR